MTTWVVVARDPGPRGQAYRLLAHTRAHVADLLTDERARGREVHIEDTNGTRIDDTAFNKR